MKKNSISRYVLMAVIGFIVFAVGLAFSIFFPNANGAFKTLPYICIGLGAGLFGGNIGTAIKNRALLNNPNVKRQMIIEQNDERNQSLLNKSKARVYDLMMYLFAAIILVFLLLQVKTFVTLTLTAVYLFFIFANIYYINKYNKKM